MKVNVSKGGMSITVGRKGFHLNFSKRGVKQTIGLPGSGLSQSSYLYKNDPDDETEKKEEAEAELEEAIPARRKRRTRSTRGEAAQGRSSPWGFFLFTFIAVFLIYVGGVFFRVAATFKPDYAISTAPNAMGRADRPVMTETKQTSILLKKHPKTNCLRMFHHLLILLFVFELSFLL